MPPAPRPTHFLCLPLITSTSLPQLAASLATFRSDPAILLNPARGQAGRPRLPPRREERPGYDSESEDGAPGSTRTPREGYIPLTAVRPVGTLHLTLGVMHLENKDRVEAASDFLRTLDVDVELQKPTEQEIKDTESNATSTSNSKTDTVTQTIQPTPERTQHKQLDVQLKGLHAMQQVTRTRVLYAEPIDSSARLFPFCERLRNRFVQAGLMTDEGRDLKLHATIVNTIYASKHKNSKGKKNIEFDASELIERWKDKIWADISISKVAICEMGAKEDADGNVRYVEIAEKVLG